MIEETAEAAQRAVYSGAQIAAWCALICVLALVLAPVVVLFINWSALDVLR